MHHIIFYYVRFTNVQPTLSIEFSVNTALIQRRYSVNTALLQRYYSVDTALIQRYYGVTTALCNSSGWLAAWSGDVSTVETNPARTDPPPDPSSTPPDTWQLQTKSSLITTQPCIMIDNMYSQPKKLNVRNSWVYIIQFLPYI